MNIRSLSLIAALACIWMAVLTAPAQATTITAEHTCVLGDNETKAQARKICYLEAKRKLLEKAGTVVVADTRIRDMQVQSDEVRAYAMARMRVKVVEEEFFVTSGNFAVRTIVSADVDVEDFAEVMTRMREEPQRFEGARDRARRAERLEDRVFDLRDRIDAYGPGGPYAVDQEQALRSLEEIEAEGRAITEGISRTSRLARDVVRRGMTESEVKRLLGEPRAVRGHQGASDWLCLNYGNIWVVFKNGLVACMRTELRYSRRKDSDCHCEGFAGEVF